MGNHLQAQQLTKQAFAIVSRGLEAGTQGRFDDARRLFEEALRLLDIAVEADPSYAHAHNERSFVLIRLRRTDEAAESARKAISLEPHVPKFRMALIGIGLKEIESQKSRQVRKRSAETYEKVIEEIIRMFPGYPSGYLAQAQLRAMTGAGQSVWEASLSAAARAYSGMKTMSSGEPATEEAIEKTMRGGTIRCLELAREWDRLSD